MKSTLQMKNKLTYLLRSKVHNSFFTIACILLLALGAASWVGISCIGAEADAGLAVLRAATAGGRPDAST